MCNLFSFTRCAVAMASLFLVSTSDVGPNTFCQNVANILEVVRRAIMQHLSTLVYLIQCLPFPGGYSVLARFNTYFHATVGPKSFGS